MIRQCPEKALFWRTMCCSAAWRLLFSWAPCSLLRPRHSTAAGSPSVVPTFDSLGRPIALVLLFLMAMAPVLPWRKASTELVSQRLFWPAVTSVVVTAVAVLWFGARGFYPVITFAMGGFAGGAAGRQVLIATRRQGWRGFVGRTNGGMIVHLGVVLLALGVAASESYKTDRVATLRPGESVEVGDHTFTYLSARAEETARVQRVLALIQIDGGDVYEPARTRYRQQGMIVGTPSVKPGFQEDLFLVLDESPETSTSPIRLRVVIRPMITWIWAGGILMGLGTLLAVFPGKRRRGTEAVSAAVAGEPPAAEPTTCRTTRKRGRRCRNRPCLRILPRPLTPDALEPDRRIRLIAGSVGVLVFGLIMLFAFGRTSAVDEPSSLLSRRVPAVAGPLVPTDADYPSDQYSIDNHRGQWVLVNFFATWCPPCIAEHPELVAIDETSDVELVSVVFDDSLQPT